MPFSRRVQRTTVCYRSPHAPFGLLALYAESVRQFQPGYCSETPELRNLLSSAGPSNILKYCAISGPRICRYQMQMNNTGHTSWVRISHWIVTVSFMTLAFTGFVILMAHPRLYWGEVGNDLTPALIELPISRNHQHGGWENSAPFFQRRGFSGQRESHLSTFSTRIAGGGVCTFSRPGSSS